LADTFGIRAKFSDRGTHLITVSLLWCVNEQHVAENAERSAGSDSEVTPDCARR
jgi:hypothetical protein